MLSTGAWSGRNGGSKKRTSTGFGFEIGTAGERRASGSVAEKKRIERVKKEGRLCGD